MVSQYAQRPFPKDVDEQRVQALFAVYGRFVLLLCLVLHTATGWKCC